MNEGQIPLPTVEVVAAMPTGDNDTPRCVKINS